MTIDKLKLIDYSTPAGTPYVTFNVYTNCYHVHILDKDSEKVLYKRTPDMDEWLDEKHTRITRAISELESALLDVV